MDRATHSRAMSAAQARPHRAVLKHAPLAPAVFADLSILVERFEVGPGHGLAEFKEAWQQMEFGRIFSTQKLAGRVPGTDETHEEYIVLLLRAATAHLCPNRYPQFEHRLGGIFLVWMLHATQPLEPKVPVRVDAVDWANLEALARECEQRQHAEGYRALYEVTDLGLSEEGAEEERPAVLQHTVAHSVLANDLRAWAVAQKEGEALAKKLRPQEMGPSPYAMQLEPTLKALRELEQARGDARAALGVPDDRGPHHLSDELRAALSRVERGDHPVPAQQPAPLQTPAAAEHSVSEAYSRRQAARSRPYSEGRSRVPRRDEEAVG